MKKVLIITYYWPPAGGPGVQRVLKFAKYLPEFGWQPVVMTVEKGDFPAYDYELEKEVPKNLKTYKIPIWEPHNLYRKWSGIKGDETIPVAILAEKHETSFKKKFAKSIRANLFIPDARIGWYFTAVSHGKKIIQDEGIDLIFVSSPPHSLQLIGKKLKSETALPLVSDFRDPWTGIHYYHHLNRSSIAKKIDSKFEKKILANTNLLLTVSPSLKSDFEKIYPKVNCKVIYNGFDQADFSDLKKVKKTETFTLSYIGNFKANQNVASLWQVLEEMVAENKNFADKLKLEFTGKVNPEVIQSIKDHNLFQYMTINDYVPHHNAIIKMKEASGLLFIIPFAKNNSGILTGKLFDYLASGSPFLSIGPEQGDAAKILSEVRGGQVFNYEDKTNIKNRIQELFDHWGKDTLTSIAPQKKLVNKYERRSLSGALADIFESLVN